MERLARAFDEPLDSPSHRDLAEHGWVAGEDVTVLYWLGRLLQRNLFRESNDSVKAALQQYFIDRGQEKGASLLPDFQAWRPVAILLQHHAGHRPPKNPRLVAALEAVMTNPALTDAQLATLANTTAKQVARITEVFVLRKLWKQRQISGVQVTDNSTDMGTAVARAIVKRQRT